MSETPSKANPTSARVRIAEGLGAIGGAFLLGALLALRTRQQLWVAWGLLTPAALGCALAVFLLTLSGSVPDAATLGRLANRTGAARRCSAWVLALGVGWLSAGQLALVGLGRWGEEPRVAGAALALGVLALLLGLSLLVELTSGILARSVRLDAWSRKFGRLRWLAPFGLALVAFGIPILVGETSGRGHAWALMGVFRRPELDVRPVLDLLVLGFGALVASILAARWRKTFVELGIVALALCVLTSLSARDLDARQATEIARSGGLASVTLGLLSARFDADRDGASPYYGGGDCNDADARIYPGAIDEAGSGIDEDCDGQDATAPPPTTSAASAAPPAADARSWPKDANVLLLTVDTLRFDLGYMHPGGGGRRSPRLDALAERCTVFERAYSLASYTAKSLGPMMIGKYSSEVARTFEHFDRFGKTESFLQERIHEAGHRTVSVQAYWYFFLKGYGFERGFDRLDHTAAPKLIAVDGDASVTGEKLADRTIAELEALDRHTGRFFAWAHWVDPHSEYVAHAEFDLGASSRQRYDGEVAYVDHQLGRVLDALVARPFAERTVILVTSDHGEAFGEHGMIRHGFELWEELVRVPLLLCVPGAPARRVTVPRSLIDLAPTVLELMDIETAPGELRGVSLLRDVAGPEPALRPVLVDMPRGPNNQERRAFLSGNYKLITSAGRVIGLYDLSTDPAEMTDLSSNESLVGQVQAEFKAYLSTLKVRAPG